MTVEQMKEQAEKVMAALRAAGFEEVELLEFKEGESLPIAYADDEGTQFVLSLDAL